MAGSTSIQQIDLTPIAGKAYFSIDRDWREEVIYFLLTDRFHDGVARASVSGAQRSAGFATPNTFYGGTLRGITSHLDYIAGLGCSAVWLAPVFENNAGAYHGYDINNYLGVDPHFGTLQDLIDLVDAAHGFVLNGKPWPMRVILDVVINHSGDNWSYPGNVPYYYSNDQQFGFGGWRRGDRPIPTELRRPDFYHRRGQIGNYDAYPEVQHGDISSLKDYDNDDDATGSDVINALIKAHCYWIREADVDGFRVDAVKHMGTVACSRFCSNVREYAQSLGKRHFFLFGEVATPSDDIYNGYLGPNTSVDDPGGTVFFGLDSVLDFRLAEGVYGDDANAPLRDVLKSFKSPQTLFNRLEAQRERALNRGELGRFLVTFVDNHDSFWQPTGRFGHGATDEQIIGAAGFLLTTLGTPCLYYGTEQGLSGAGDDNAIREALFDVQAGGKNILNPACNIYRAIGEVAAVRRARAELRFGRMYYRQISGDGVNFGLAYGSACTLALSRLLYGSEVLVAFNVSGQSRADHVVVDAILHPADSSMQFLYGGTGSIPVSTAPDGTRYVTLPLAPYQFAILK
jgi:alpha-amylase